MIRQRLDQANPQHYTDIPSFIADVRKLLNNVYLYYQVCGSFTEVRYFLFLFYLFRSFSTSLTIPFVEHINKSFLAILGGHVNLQERTKIGKVFQPAAGQVAAQVQDSR
jgi:hypothetical protein